jgi:uncharacterized lipoprotein YajG
MKNLILAAAVLALAGCAFAPEPVKHVTSPMGCTATAPSAAGMVQVERCTAWEFGPSIEQQRRFERR